jgi:hypothetical protein
VGSEQRRRRQRQRQQIAEGSRSREKNTGEDACSNGKNSAVSNKNAGKMPALPKMEPKTKGARKACPQKREQDFYVTYQRERTQ